MIYHNKLITHGNAGHFLFRTGLSKKIFFSGIILGLILFFAIPNFSYSAECRITNVVTDKFQVVPGEILQIDIVGTSECVGKDVDIFVCDSLGCYALDIKTFSGKTVFGQTVSVPIVYKWAAESLAVMDLKSPVHVLAEGPSNSVKGKDFLISGAIIPGPEFTETEFTLSISEPIGSGGNLNNFINGGAGPFLWTKIGGKLPDGVDLAVDGSLVGTPTKTGTYISSLRIEDRYGKTFDQSITIEVISGEDGSLNGGGNGGGGTNDISGLPGINLTIQGLEEILSDLVCWVYRVAFMLIIIFIIWSGIRYAYSGGNPQKVSATHEAFKWVIIGAAVILGVGVIISTIANALGTTIPFPGFC